MSRKKFSNIPMTQSGIATLGGAGTVTVTNVFLEDGSTIFLMRQDLAALAGQLGITGEAFGNPGASQFTIGHSAGAGAAGDTINWFIHSPSGNPSQM